MADVVYFARDMVFTSKIREVARQMGVNVLSVRDPAALATQAAAGARLAIVDLRLPEALEALAALQANPACAAVATVGFIDHEKTDVMEAARAAGLQGGPDQGPICPRAAQVARQVTRRGKPRRAPLRGRESGGPRSGAGRGRSAKIGRRSASCLEWSSA